MFVAKYKLFYYLNSFELKKVHYIFSYNVFSL